MLAITSAINKVISTQGLSATICTIRVVPVKVDRKIKAQSKTKNRVITPMIYGSQAVCADNLIEKSENDVTPSSKPCS